MGLDTVVPCLHWRACTNTQLFDLCWPAFVPRRFGFNNGKTMVDGLDGEKTPGTWEGGDFATIVHQLKLLGFNAVRLPFLFGDLYTQPPQVCCCAPCGCLQGS